MSRKIQFADGEFYHIYNRGVDKRDIFMKREDLFRFLKYLKILNNSDPVGSLREYDSKESKNRGLASENLKLVEIVCFCLNPNHYHLLLKQVRENGISKFMHRLGTAYTMYFNEENKRSGSLFQGSFRAVHIDSNEYLLHLGAYINLNFEVHGKWRGVENPMTYSSWGEYLGENRDTFCQKDIILDQFSGSEEYRIFAKDSVAETKNKRKQENIENYFLKPYLLE